MLCGNGGGKTSAASVRSGRSEREAGRAPNGSSTPAERNGPGSRARANLSVRRQPPPLGNICRIPQEERGDGGEAGPGPTRSVCLRLARSRRSVCGSHMTTRDVCVGKHLHGQKLPRCRVAGAVGPNGSAERGRGSESPLLLLSVISPSDGRRPSVGSSQCSFV